MPTFAIGDDQYQIRLHFGVLDQIRQAGYDLLAGPAETIQILTTPRAVVTILHILCNPKGNPEDWAARFAALDLIERGTEVLLEALADFVGGRGEPLRVAAARIRQTRAEQEAQTPALCERLRTMQIGPVPGDKPGSSPEPSGSAASTDSRSGS